MRTVNNFFRCCPISVLFLMLIGSKGLNADPEVTTPHQVPAITRVKPLNVDGRRYQAEIPDTLDLAERAELAIQYLTNAVDPEHDYETDPGVGGFFLTVKYLEALPLMREMSGSEYNLDVESKMMDSFVSNIDDDGLLFGGGSTTCSE